MLQFTNLTDRPHHDRALTRNALHRIVCVTLPSCRGSQTDKMFGVLLRKPLILLAFS
jgi:YD repeat-containing protein